MIWKFKEEKKPNICIGSMNSWFESSSKIKKKKKHIYCKLVIILDVKIQGTKKLNRVFTLINITSPI